MASSPYIDTRYIRDLNVALLTLNTAWMSRGGLNNWNDARHLLVSGKLYS
jgi:hypothetical protein